MRITSGGNVIIGSTTDPSVKFQAVQTTSGEWAGDFKNYSSGAYGSRPNSYGGVSEVKLKQDIVDASSQWDDIKAIRVRKFRFKDEPNAALQIGVVAQEIEQTSAGLVYETPDFTRNENGEKVETGEVTKAVKYSILYMKAIKALQEAMERIETLEAKVNTLENK
jgi:hypothetical protein